MNETEKQKKTFFTENEVVSWAETFRSFRSYSCIFKHRKKIFVILWFFVPANVVQVSNENSHRSTQHWSFEIPLGSFTSSLLSLWMWENWERERENCRKILSFSESWEAQKHFENSDKFSSTFSFSFASKFLCESYGQVSCVCLVRRKERKKSLIKRISKKFEFSFA